MAIADATPSGTYDLRGQVHQAATDQEQYRRMLWERTRAALDPELRGALDDTRRQLTAAEQALATVQQSLDGHTGMRERLGALGWTRRRAALERERDVCTLAVAEARQVFEDIAERVRAAMHTAALQRVPASDLAMHEAQARSQDLRAQARQVLKAANAEREALGRLIDTLDRGGPDLFRDAEAPRGDQA